MDPGSPGGDCMSPKKKPTGEPSNKGWVTRGATGGERMARESEAHEKAREAEAKAEPAAQEPARLPVDKILDRAHGDTRPLNAAHVVDLAETFSQGEDREPQPIVVDPKNRLVMGGHRREALRLLSMRDDKKRADRVGELLGDPAEDDEDRAALRKALKARARSLKAPAWLAAGAPIQRRSYDSETEKRKALLDEISENERRRDYTPAEVAEYVRRLEKEGFTTKVGRPKKGEESAVAALAGALRLTRRRVNQLLAEAAGKREAASHFPKPDPKPADFPAQAKAVHRALAKALEDRRSLPRGKDGKAIVEAMEALASDLETYLKGKK